jgi:hypothetical protein
MRGEGLQVRRSAGATGGVKSRNGKKDGRSRVGMIMIIMIGHLVVLCAS